MKKIRYALYLFFIVILLSACGSDDSTKVDKNGNNKGEEEQSELRVSLSNIPPSLDPPTTTSVITAEVSRHIYETLVAYDENYQAQPMLADSWDVNDDHTKYTFHLREGVKFHDGKEMTSEDVVASLERWFTWNSRVANLFGEDMELTAIDDFTVEITLDKPFFLAVETLALPAQFGAIMPKEIIEEAGSDPVEKYIGTGPFMVSDYVADQKLVLDKYEDFVPRDEKSSGLAGAKNPGVETIIFEFLADDSTRVSSLIAGDHDVARLVPYDSYDQVESDENLTTVLSEGGTEAIIFNKKKGVFADKDLREALLIGLNFTDLSIGTYGDERFFDLDSSISLEEQIDWHSNIADEYYDINDPELAKQMIEESSYDGEEITILTSTTSTHRDMSITLQQQLEDLGMNAAVETLEFSVLMEYDEDPDLWDIEVVDATIQANPTLDMFLHSEFETPGWSDDRDIDETIDRIKSASSSEEAREEVELLHKLFYEYVPVIYPSKRYMITGLSADVEGFESFAKGMVLWNVSKK